MAKGICSVADCECRVFCSGLCQAHYARWRRHGDPLVGRYVHKCRQPRPCAIEGCVRHHMAHGYCELHYLRFVKSGGDLDVVALDGIKPASLNPKWRGDAAGYEAIHSRLKREHGKASEHACARCDESAVDWAYDHACPNEKTVERRGRIYAYSTNPDRYLPLCRSCHTRLDKGLLGA